MHVNWCKDKEHCALKTTEQVNTFRKANSKYLEYEFCLLLQTRTYFPKSLFNTKQG